MKKRIFIGISGGIGLICLVAIVFFAVVFWFDNGLKYIQRTTGVTLPYGISQIDVFDNIEHYTVAHVKLCKEDIVSFRDEYGFGLTSFSESPSPWIETLKLENRVIPDNADLRYLEGRSKNNRWLFVLDQNSGRLWIVVFYSDPGGTLP